MRSEVKRLAIETNLIVTFRNGNQEVILFIYFCDAGDQDQGPLACLASNLPLTYSPVTENSVAFVTMLKTQRMGKE
jgi:hypothetical protein